MKKRFFVLAFTFMFCFTVVAGRCIYVSTSEAFQVNDSYNSYTLNIAASKPCIYDRRGQLLGERKIGYSAVIRPDEKCLSELSLFFNNDEIKEIIDELSKGYPIVRPVKENKNCKYIKIFKTAETDYQGSTCRHLLDEMCGGLSSYLPDKTGELSINFPITATGRLLEGNTGEVINDNYDNKNGEIISIDSRVQYVAEAAAKSIKKGAVVVMDAASSQILASVSRGNDFNNRALASYAVGSVFKIIVCACALENDIDINYNCVSSIKVGDTEFSCQNRQSHGSQNMKQALANSCNCYFVNLARHLGSSKIYETAKKFGFGNSYPLYKNWVVSSGEFPDISTLRSSGQLSLLGFGQGKLTDSPAHFAAAVSCIANGGNYNSPTVELNDIEENRIISEKTSNILKSYMHYVVTDGTGIAANYKNSTAGKTATAQSGIYLNGREILNTWFAGFFPVDNPKYTIVVMCENGTSGAGDCCPVFREIVEKLENL